MHLAALVGAIAFFSWTGVLLAIGSYFVRMVLVTAAYHRYFSHRSFKTSRAFQFLLALGAQSSAQKGVLWWASHHRFHHKNSDTPADIHSVRRSGFWHSHLGWILGSQWDDTNHDLIADLTKYPELRALNRGGIQMLPAVALALGCLLLGGMTGLVWGFLVSTVLLWHGSFSINSLSHMFGKRRYTTTDDSKNNPILAIITMGEGWHNNHHYYAASARQGFYWWEFDPVYYALRALSWVGIVRGLRTPPKAVRDARPAPDAYDAGLVRASLERCLELTGNSTDATRAELDHTVRAALDVTDGAIKGARADRRVALTAER
jgi:stearoyl-CoA desaturase (Delta-9 desaturase)